MDGRLFHIIERVWHARSRGEQVRAFRHGLEARLGVNVREMHPLVSWMVERVAEMLSMYEVGADGRTGYERMKGKLCPHDVVEFGEKAHYKYPKGFRRQEKQLEGIWGEIIFLAKYWGRGGGAIVGSPEGRRRASTIRRVGAHRRWDTEGLSEIRRVPWIWNPEAEVQPRCVRVRFLAEGEKLTGKREVHKGENDIYQKDLRSEDFLMLSNGGATGMLDGKGHAGGLRVGRCGGPRHVKVMV